MLEGKMKVEITKAMNAHGEVFNIKVSYSNGKIEFYDFFTKEEAYAFLRGIYG